MAKQSTLRQSGSDPNEALDQLTALNGAALEAMQRCGRSGIEQMTRLGDELTEFVGKRVRHDAEFGQALANCRNWADVVELQQGWFTTMASEYSKESRRLMEMTSKMWAEGLQPFYDAAAKAGGPPLSEGTAPKGSHR